MATPCIFLNRYIAFRTFMSTHVKGPVFILLFLSFLAGLILMPFCLAGIANIFPTLAALYLFSSLLCFNDVLTALNWTEFLFRISSNLMIKHESFEFFK